MAECALKRDDVGVASYPSIGSVKNLICVTIYNESAEMVAATLGSVARSRRLSERSAGYGDGGTVVCLIVDGVDRMSASARSYLEGLGFAFSPSANGDDGELDVSVATVSLRSLVTEDANWLLASEESGQGLAVMLCVKRQNRGKLDSHWWFYERICPLLQPTYCYQVDAGTVLNTRALRSMAEHFEADSRVAAVASNVLLAADARRGLLGAVQSGEFAIEKSLIFPSEELFGYLSVMPGQFSAISWKAFSSESGDGRSPRDRYLDGMSCETGFEKTKFLAEDRVLGYELLRSDAAENSVSFANDSVAYTDSCSDLDELLKQRRRWINSSFACRSWMLRSLPSYARHPLHGPGRRLRVMASAINLGAYHWLDFFMPLLAALAVLGTASAAGELVQRDVLARWQVWPVLGAAAVGWLLPALYAFATDGRRRSRFGTEVVYGVTAASVLAMVIINAMASTASLALLGAVFGVVAMQSFGLHRELGIVWLRTAVPYLLLIGPVRLMLTSYAFVNLHDSSWGTKGLNSTVEGDRIGHSLARSLDQLRGRFVGIWVATNLLLVAGAILSAPVRQLLIGVFLAVTGFIFLAGLLGNAKRVVGAGRELLVQGRRPRPSRLASSYR